MNNTNKEARWKGAGMGEYYCSLCCEVGDIRAQRCPKCDALMYTDEEYAVKLMELEADDRWYKFWNEEVGPPPKLHELLNKKCEFCSDMDAFYDVVCYIPTENGSSIDIPMHYCPACGRKLTEEE